jgi:branched-chain amino acid transport system permease protein
VRAIRDDQQAASAIGIPVHRYKLYAAMLSAAITALAGGFMVMYLQFVDPESGLGLELSVSFTLMVVLGGVGRVWGPLLGAWVLTEIQDLTRTEFTDTSPFGSWIVSTAHDVFGTEFSFTGRSVDLLIYGALVVVVAIVEPGGLLAMAERVWKFAKGKVVRS